MLIVRSRRTAGPPVKCTEELLICSFAFLRSTNRDFPDASIFIHSTPSARNLPHPLDWTPTQRLLAAYFKNGDAGPLKLG